MPTFIVSTAKPDGNGNQTDLDGWDFTRYNANPVVFFNHHWNNPPIGKTLALTRQGETLLADIELATTPFAKQIEALIEDRFILGASMGWRPILFDIRRDPQGFPLGIHSHLQELLEISIVGLPANPETLKQALAQSEQSGTATLSFHQESLDLIIGAPQAIPPAAGQYHEVLLSTLREYNNKLRSPQ